MSTFRNLLREAKAQIRETDPAGAAAMLANGAVLLDVREPDEFEQGAVPGSVHIPRGNLEPNVENRLPDKGTPVVVMCAGGVRSAFAAQTLQEMGYGDVVSMDGGFNRWKDEGRDWALPVTLTPDQRNRYHRHLLLPEVGDGRTAQAARGQGLVPGRGRAGLSGRPVSGRRGGGHRGHRGHGRGGRLQSPSARFSTTSTGWGIARWTRPRRPSTP